MTRQPRIGPGLLAVLAAFSIGADPPRTAAKKGVLVELFVSQGCDMCPAAEGLVAAMAADERVIPIAFHVDYFNDPWPDPFSDPKFSRREMQYSVLYDRENRLNNPNYLYLTPLVLIDGRTPMVGKDDAETKARLRDAIRKALAEPPSVSIDATWSGVRDEGRSGRRLEVRLAAATTEAKGREVLVEVVPFTAKTSTRVKAGELANRVYNGRNVARGFEARAVTLPRPGAAPASASFSLTPPDRADPKADGVVVIVQDEASGRILQAARVPWAGK